MLHGYYSKKQWENNDTFYEYLDKDNKTVYVTQVNNQKLDNNEIYKYFDDNEYKGELVRFVKKHESKVKLFTFK